MLENVFKCNKVTMVMGNRKTPLYMKLTGSNLQRKPVAHKHHRHDQIVTIWRLAVTPHMAL